MRLLLSAALLQNKDTILLFFMHWVKHTPTAQSDVDRYGRHKNTLKTSHLNAVWMRQVMAARRTRVFIKMLIYVICATCSGHQGWKKREQS